MSPAIRIFRWADAPEEYRTVPERKWLAFVPASREFNATKEAGWKNVVSGAAPGGAVQAGDDA